MRQKLSIVDSKSYTKILKMHDLIALIVSKDPKLYHICKTVYFSVF